ncbi:hypothetical protein [Leisingera methylohalidivorans]|uniref:O-linked N-acetylglucosamine transferase family protein n=1 Tax=Leisingera methylohalidivorans TaxID=133924 RepID=UPI001FDEC718|nr:hypothetical protein [Leisingera methylohalidivorans]
MEFSRLRAIDRKIRLGYFLNGFFNHGTMILMESQLKMHDRDQFEVFICDYGQANDQKGRQRAEVAADVYKPVADKEIVGIAAIAHTTASGALRAGVPVVTKIGKQFAARVASSLLHNVGMEELVASTPQKYQALALKPARDPAYLAGVQARVKNGIATGPLYDT